mgnify:CR=1 FL=1
MKKKDTLDRRLGPTIREIGNRHGLSVTNLKSALAESFNDRRKGWADEMWSMERKPSAAICMTGLGPIWSARLV